MKHYYIPFDLSANINYLYLFSLYDIAEYNEKNNTFDTIHYKSIKQLAEMLNISASTMNKIIKDKEYNNFLSIDKENKKIILNNNFNKTNTENKNKPFILLNDIQVKVLSHYKDNLLCKYFIYIKYFCGYSKSKQQDFTAKQFLQFCGYSIKSNDNITRISNYNNILTRNKLIKIQHYTDDLGHLRNIYTVK